MPQAVFVHRLRACVSDRLASAERVPAPAPALDAAAIAPNPSAMSIETAAPARLQIPGALPSKSPYKAPIPKTRIVGPDPHWAAPPAQLAATSPVYSKSSHH